MKSFVIPRDAPSTGDSKYEKAPGEEINNQSIIAMNIYNTSADEQRVASLESECASLQQDIAALIKKQQEDQQNQAKNYEWQTSDGDKPEKQASFSVGPLAIVFIVSAMLGAYLVK